MQYALLLDSMQSHLVCHQRLFYSLVTESTVMLVWWRFESVCIRRQRCQIARRVARRGDISTGTAARLARLPQSVSSCPNPAGIPGTARRPPGNFRRLIWTMKTMLIGYVLTCMPSFGINIYTMERITPTEKGRAAENAEAVGLVMRIGKLNLHVSFSIPANCVAVFPAVELRSDPNFPAAHRSSILDPSPSRRSDSQVQAQRGGPDFWHLAN